MMHRRPPHGSPAGRSRSMKMFGLVIGGHALFVALKLVGIVAALAALREVQVEFGTVATLLVAVHLLAAAGIIAAYRLKGQIWRRRH